MSEYRQLHRSFWESGSVEKMDPVEKLLYVYLITAPASNMEGLYKTSLRRIAFETGIDADMVRQLCDRLEAKRLAGFRDGWACVTQATKHMPGSNKQLMTHARKVYDECPTEVLEWATGIGYTLAGAMDDSYMAHRTRLDNTKQTRQTDMGHDEFGNLRAAVGLARNIGPADADSEE